MLNKRRLTIVLVIIAIAASACTAQIRFDTIAVATVGPGIRYTKVVASSVPWSLHVLDIDLKNPYVSLETIKANNRLIGTERTSSMATRNSYSGHTVIGAVNGDYFSGTGIPNGIQIAGGEVVSMPYTWSAFGVNDQKKPMINVVSLNGSLTTKTSVSTLSAINTARWSGALMLYNSYYGVSTGTTADGNEFLVSPLSGWIVNDTVACVVESKLISAGNTVIPKGKAVLSASGTIATTLDAAIQQNDTIRLYIEVAPVLKRLVQMTAGFPKIVSGGVNYALTGYREEGGNSTFATDRHPRTGIGFNADSTRAFFVVVDGRQSQLSLGMSLIELAEYFVNIGASTAMNMDGGGSTTMVVRGVVMNSPSDGSERLIGNSVQAVSSAPIGPFDHVELNPRKLKIFTGDKYQLQVQGIDQNGNPCALDTSKLRFSIVSKLGTITNAGFLTAATKRDSGYIVYTYDSQRDSIYMIITGVARLQVRPKIATTDTIKKIIFAVTAFDQDNIVRVPMPGVLQWQVADATIGSIDNGGVFSGKKPGTTIVRAVYESVSDSATATVYVGSGSPVLDSMNTITGWMLNKINVDAALLSASSEMHTLGDYSLKATYTFTSKVASPSYLYLDTSIPVNGVPDSILVDVRGDSTTYVISYIVQTNDNQSFRLLSNVIINDTNKTSTIRTFTGNATPLVAGSPYFYPITIKRIEIRVHTIGKVEGKQYAGIIYLDNLRAHYPTTSVIKTTSLSPDGYVLAQNYPNPFNPTTTIMVSLPQSGQASLKIFNTLGVEVTTLYQGTLSAGYHKFQWRADQFPTGIYFCRLQSGEYTATKKLVLVK
jgi:hypothetical protein